MRCRALARGLRRRGADIFFFCRDLPGWMIRELDTDGFHYVPLDGGRDEVECLIDRLTSCSGSPFDWLVVDHYGWEERQESAVAPYVRRLMVIDDLANRTHYCHMLLDQNDEYPNRDRYHGLVPHFARLLLGCRNALLREEFAVSRTSMKRRNGRVCTLFVCFGGSDPTNETAKALEAIDDAAFAELNVHVVVGRSHSRIEQIVNRCQSDPRIRIHVQSNQIAKLMAESDLAICAGGTMTWERYCMGLPALVIAVADNQVEVAKSGERAGVDRYLGKSEQVGVELIRSTLREAMNDTGWLRHAECTAMEKVDGMGVDRVVNAMFEAG